MREEEKLDFSSNSDLEIPISEQSFHAEVPYSENISKFQIKRGTLNSITRKYESLDYVKIENDMLIQSEEKEGYMYFVRKNIMQWIVFLLIGVSTACVASTVDIGIVELIKYKYKILTPYLNDNSLPYSKPLCMWMILNMIPVFVGTILVTYFEPLAAGSGIPHVKCYLNGIELPKILALKTLFVKASGLVCTIAGGVASGKEGPMIHVGAAVAYVVSKGRLMFGKRELHFCRYFRDDQERRDFVSAGAASGVSAAFGASVGGVLFSLEEGASFWNQNLTWRIFFGSVVSTFTVNFILSAYHGQPGNLTHPSLINMGKLDFTYEIGEIPIFALFGSFGGLLGALWNHLNYKLSLLRYRIFKWKWLKVVEACFIAALSAFTAFTMAISLPGCSNREAVKESNSLTPRVYCEKSTDFNMVASMWLQTPQGTVRHLLHDPADLYPLINLTIFTFIYFFLSCISFGISMSNGVFVPSLLTGAAWGRLLASLFILIFPAFKQKVDAGKYAMIGAAAHLGGLVRMTISLTVIIMETSDNISFSLPIIITLISAKWTGDFFNDGIYITQIKLRKAPFLPFDPPPMAHNIFATDVMNTPVKSFRVVESVDYIYNILETTKHQGFPVLEETERVVDKSKDLRYGKIVGSILREQLLLILEKKWFYETIDTWKTQLNANLFRDVYLHRKSIIDIDLSFQERMESSIDLRIFMNNSPYTLLRTASLPKMFRLFRAIGLRHLPIVNDSNEVIGMVTRKDLAKFRYFIKKGRMQLVLYNILND